MSGTAKHAVIVGAGHAGGSVAALLRQYGWQGPITLIGSEPTPPYQRPPLSKAWLQGTATLAEVSLRAADFYPANRIDLLLSSPVTIIDRTSRSVMLTSGVRVAYDNLILALGARPRALPVPGCDLPCVLELRTLADADRLKAALRPGLRLAVIGGGYIGLEVAASARALGAEVVVIERETRLLARVASPPLSAFFHQRHREAGVGILLDSTVAGIEDGRVCLAQGTSVPCDLALIGVGAVPNDELARSAGLECRNGIVVDTAARTADAAIHAIGDCTLRPLPLYQQACRLESVPNALEQAKQAAADLCGRKPPAADVPWFWSDQYDVRLQIAGLPFDVAETVLRGDPATGAFAVFHLAADATLQTVEAVNASADFMAGRMMIAKRKKVVAARLADMSVSLRDLAA